MTARQHQLAALAVLVLGATGAAAQFQPTLALTAANSDAWAIGSTETLQLNTTFSPRGGEGIFAAWGPGGAAPFNASFALQASGSSQPVVLCNNATPGQAQCSGDGPNRACFFSTSCSAVLSAPSLQPGTWEAIATITTCLRRQEQCSTQSTSTNVNLVLGTAAPISVAQPTLVARPQTPDAPSASNAPSLPTTAGTPSVESGSSGLAPTTIGLIVGACVLASGGLAAVVLRRTQRDRKNQQRMYPEEPPFAPGAARNGERIVSMPPKALSNTHSIMMEDASNFRSASPANQKTQITESPLSTARSVPDMASSYQSMSSLASVETVRVSMTKYPALMLQKIETTIESPLLFTRASIDRLKSRRSLVEPEMTRELLHDLENTEHDSALESPLRPAAV